MLSGDFIERQRKFDSAISKWVKVNLLGCWEWVGYKRRAKLPRALAYGYLMSTKESGRRGWILAHRMMYLACHGVDPGNLMVRHKCDNPLCVNPYHLELGTAKDNAADRESRGRGRYRNLPPKPPPKGKNPHPAAKLSEDQVEKIRECLADGGLTGREIAAMFSVSPQAICYIRKGHTWKQPKAKT